MTLPVGTLQMHTFARGKVKAAKGVDLTCLTHLFPPRPNNHKVIPIFAPKTADVMKKGFALLTIFELKSVIGNFPPAGLGPLPVLYPLPEERSATLQICCGWGVGCVCCRRCIVGNWECPGRGGDPRDGAWIDDVKSSLFVLASPTLGWIRFLLLKREVLGNESGSDVEWGIYRHMTCDVSGAYFSNDWFLFAFYTACSDMKLGYWSRCLRVKKKSLDQAAMTSALCIWMVERNLTRVQKKWEASVQPPA